MCMSLDVAAVSFFSMFTNGLKKKQNSPREKESFFSCLHNQVGGYTHLDIYAVTMDSSEHQLQKRELYF